MSYALEGYAYQDMASTPAIPASAADPVPRSIWGPLLFLGPVLISGVSYAAGGIPMITDTAFILLTALCVVFLIGELKVFPRRQGIGGILIFGGVLVWFCHDYLSKWFFADFNNPNVPISADVISKAFFFHCLFIEIMVWTVNKSIFTWAEKLVVAVPEPSNNSLYLVLLIMLMAFGLCPFFIFVKESPADALWKTVSGNGNDVLWAVSRSYIGHAMNVNYDWGGYVAQILQVGTMAGVFGAAYAILIARTLPTKLFGWACWLFWCIYSAPGLRRGELAFMGMPAMGLLFYKYQVQASAYLRRQGWKSYAFGGFVGIILFVAVQYEGSARENISLDLTTARGDTMFSEGLRAWELFPDKAGGFFYDTFPGAGIVRPIPQSLYWLLIDPIPRALWHNKPIDEFGPWYSNFITGESSGAYGTTISGGAVGGWYFQYGPFGVVNGGLVYGWLMGVAERSLRRARGRPTAVLLTLCFATFIFRSYRDLWWHNLYPIMIAGVVMYILVKVFAGGGRRPEAVEVAA